MKTDRKRKIIFRGENKQLVFGRAAVGRYGRNGSKNVGERDGRATVMKLVSVLFVSSVFVGCCSS